MAHKRKHDMGSGGDCFCPKCETIAPHDSGTPCIETVCPNCGAKMLRMDSEHYEAFLKKQEKKKADKEDEKNKD